MTESELLAWGKQEHQIRLDDIARVRAGALSISDAQEAANLRSRRAGISADATHRALRLARISRI
jgi:hypothetical protein